MGKGRLISMPSKAEYLKAWHLRHKGASAFYTQRRRVLHPSHINWERMMSRCYNRNNHEYRPYGGRGIEVYFPWHEFATYESEWGFSKPIGRYTVDRINNDGNYGPGNVRWLTFAEQNYRKRGTKICRNGFTPR